MKLKDLLNWIKNNDCADDYEIFVSTNNLTDIRKDAENRRVIFEVENPLESYYEYQSKMDMLEDIIADIKNSADVVEVSEIEVVEIAHRLELGFEDVADEFKKNNINVEVI